MLFDGAVLTQGYYNGQYVRREREYQPSIDTTITQAFEGNGCGE